MYNTMCAIIRCYKEVFFFPIVFSSMDLKKICLLYPCWIYLQEPEGLAELYYVQ